MSRPAAKGLHGRRLEFIQSRLDCDSFLPRFLLRATPVRHQTLYPSGSSTLSHRCIYPGYRSATLLPGSPITAPQAHQAGVYT